MRDRTRSYTTDLPRIGLPFLANMRSRLADAEPGTQLYTQTESGTLYAFRQADSYGARHFREEETRLIFYGAAARGAE